MALQVFPVAVTPTSATPVYSYLHGSLLAAAALEPLTGKLLHHKQIKKKPFHTVQRKTEGIHCR